MYLSKLELNPRQREARRDLAQPYELHRTLARAFATPAGQDYRAAHGVLFRLEGAAPGGRPVVLVQSLTAPDWSALPTSYTVQLVPVKPLTLACTAGQVLGFRLVANPTKKVSAPGQRQGKRIALLDAGDGGGPTPAQQWLRRKAELSGFELLHVLSEELRLNGGRAAARAGKLQLPLYGVRFDGLLRVSDPAGFEEAVRRGIGPAKTFGFGLLSLARPVSG